jgi:signal transduction histidine kinase
MNLFFILLRLFNYILLVGFSLYYNHSLTWMEWLVTAMVVGWGAWDRWKKPNDDIKWMRYGVWLEVIAITCWVVSVQSYVLLFAFISPLARASIHLSIRDRIVILIYCSISAFGYGWWVPGSIFFIPILTYLFVVAYSSLIGSLMSERQRAQRLIGLSKFEREQRVREQERIRISRQLHDTMGQYWTAVIRTIDVAEAVDLPEKQLFIQKARTAAEQGLEEMRKIVRNSNDGKQTPEQWIDFAMKSTKRIKDLTNIEIEEDVSKIDWEHYQQRVEISELMARTIIESLSNAIRHGKATRIWLCMCDKDQDLNLSIRDNGVGFLRETHSGGGLGLQSLQEMTRDVGGTFRIESERYQGTAIHLRIPNQKRGETA